MDKVWEFYLVLISDRKGIHKKVKIKIKSDKKKKLYGQGKTDNGQTHVDLIRI